MSFFSALFALLITYLFKFKDFKTSDLFLNVRDYCRQKILHLLNFHYENVNQILYLSIKIKNVGRRWVFFFIEPSTGKDCLFLHSVQSGCKAQAASYPVCTRSSFPEAMVLYHGVNLTFPLHLTSALK